MKIERAMEILDPNHREHYESIDIVNEACEMGRSALEKQIPKKPHHKDPCHVKAFDGIDRVSTFKCYPCPQCGKWIAANVNHKYCEWCGQALDWSDEE
ncbi:MAG: hypothetical protein ACI4EA_08085 [Candidatus Ornithomonoglobus sp.]